jgi:hypothetical protein
LEPNSEVRASTPPITPNCIKFNATRRDAAHGPAGAGDAETDGADEGDHDNAAYRAAPQEVLFFVTDGVEDQTVAGARVLMNPSDCTTIKNRGLRSSNKR